MQLQGGEDQAIDALRRGDLEAAEVTEREKTLLEFVALVTRHAYRTTAEDVEKLRRADWSEDQIAEAVYITAAFAMFNRVADAFGLQEPSIG